MDGTKIVLGLVGLITILSGIVPAFSGYEVYAQSNPYYPLNPYYPYPPPIQQIPQPQQPWDNEAWKNDPAVQKAQKELDEWYKNNPEPPPNNVGGYMMPGFRSLEQTQQEIELMQKLDEAKKAAGWLPNPFSTSRHHNGIIDDSMDESLGGYGGGVEKDGEMHRPGNPFMPWDKNEGSYCKPGTYETTC
jgi:hypothetical protein